MRDVSVYLDLEWITTYLQERGFALTPALVAQQIKNSAHPFGSVRQMVAFGDPESITEGMRETLETEGFRFLPKSVEMLFDEKEEIDGHTNQTVILVSGGLRDPEPFKQIRRNGCDVVVWHGTDGSADNTQWDRTDTLDRILRLQIHGIGVYVDFEGLIAAVWDSKQCTDVETVLERIDTVIGMGGTIISKVTTADWHTLRVLRDRDGNPITHEAERICRHAGYLTFDEVEGKEDARASALRRLFSRSHMMDSIAFVGGDIHETQRQALEQFEGDINYWTAEPIAETDRRRWRNIHDLFHGEKDPLAERKESGFHVFLPGLWSRVGLHVDRILSENGKEWISGSQLSRHFIKHLGIIKVPKQAELLIHAGVRNGVIRRKALGAFQRDLFTLNDTHKELLLIRELLKSLLDILGDDPAELRQLPVKTVVETLHAANLSVSGTPLDRESIQSWISFLVDEGILMRFTLPEPGQESRSVPYVTFAPTPQSVKKERPSQTAHRSTPSKKVDPGNIREQRNRSSKLIDHIIVAMDNYMIRHGKSHVPVQAIKRQVSGYSERVISSAIQQGLKEQNLSATGRVDDKNHVRNGTISLESESQHVRQVISRKQRIIDMLRRMAPMGQPMGESRIRSAFVNDLRIRNDKEAGDWIDILRQEGLLKPDQIVSELGQSFTLSLDDPAVVKNKTPLPGRRQSSRSRRFNRPGDKRRNPRRRNR